MPLRRIMGSRIKTGTYTGDGAETQAIRGVGFKPKAVIIWLHKTSASVNYGIATDQDGGLTIYIDFISPRVAYRPDHIISLDPDGFTVGDGTGTINIFNVLDGVYTFTALG